MIDQPFIDLSICALIMHCNIWWRHDEARDVFQLVHVLNCFGAPPPKLMTRMPSTILTVGRGPTSSTYHQQLAAVEPVHHPHQKSGRSLADTMRMRFPLHKKCISNLIKMKQSVFLIPY